jgi:hypothetical protein
LQALCIFRRWPVADLCKRAAFKEKGAFFAGASRVHTVRKGAITLRGRGWRILFGLFPRLFCGLFSPVVVLKLALRYCNAVYGNVHFVFFAITDHTVTPYAAVLVYFLLPFARLWP